MSVLTVNYSSGPAQTATIDYLSLLTVDGPDAGAGSGSRSIFQVAGPQVNLDNDPSSWLGSELGNLAVGGVSLSGATLTLTTVSGTTTSFTIDGSSNIIVDGPSVEAGGLSIVARQTNTIPLANATSASLV